MAGSRAPGMLIVAEEQIAKAKANVTITHP
jgi:hypothetical protein